MDSHKELYVPLTVTLMTSESTTYRDSVDDTDKLLHRDAARLEPTLVSVSQEDGTEQTVQSVDLRQTDDCSTSYSQQTSEWVNE